MLTGKQGRDHSGEQKEGRREKKVWMKVGEMVVQTTRKAGDSQEKLGAVFWRSR